MRIRARIVRMVDNEDSNIKAIANVNIGGAFAVHGIRVMDSKNGIFVQMPQSSYQKDGKTEYREIVHPITAEARTELNDAVLSAYEERLAELQDMDEDELPDFEQIM